MGSNNKNESEDNLKGVEEVDQLELLDWVGDLLYYLKFKDEVKFLSIENSMRDAKIDRIAVLVDQLKEQTTKLRKIHLRGFPYCLTHVLTLVTTYRDSLEELVLTDERQDYGQKKLAEYAKFWQNLAQELKLSRISSLRLNLWTCSNALQYLVDLITNMPNLTRIIIKPGSIDYRDKKLYSELAKLVTQKNVAFEFDDKTARSNLEKHHPNLFQTVEMNVIEEQVTRSEKVETQLADFEEEGEVHTATELQGTNKLIVKEHQAPREFLQLKELRNSLNTKGSGVKIAVLDSGVDVTHPLLGPRIKALKTFVPGELACIDYIGHGTHCAGIIVGSDHVYPSKNFAPITVGVAPEAYLIVGKVINRNGNGELANLCEAINWAVEQEADVISLSLGSKTSSNDLMVAINNAINKGVIIVTAASNYGASDSYTIGYPARFGNVICVGSHTRNGRPSEFTSIGREVDFLAPGEHIWSTGKNGGFQIATGTSAAAPFVAGIAALILAFDKKRKIKNIADMRDLLREACTKSGDHDQQSGYGILKPMKLFRPAPFSERIILGYTNKQIVSGVEPMYTDFVYCPEIINGAQCNGKIDMLKDQICPKCGNPYE